MKLNKKSTWENKINMKVLDLTVLSGEMGKLIEAYSQRLKQVDSL